MANSIICTPDPNLLESMRSVGYNLNTAIADIIDNSIAAHARQISIRYFNHGEEPYVAIIDDGDGMNYTTAINAMKLAGANPNSTRKTNDLGRFGLGLKTASLSQARSVLLSTVQDSVRHTLRWDLDHVAATRQWDLEVLDHEQMQQALPPKIYDLMPSTHGTCVLWRNLDRLQTTAGDSLREIDQVMLELSEYLGLVFHRYLHPYPEDEIKQVAITVNGIPVPERDPFLIESSTVTPVQRIPGTDAFLYGYTLPYQNKLTENDKKLLNLRESKGYTLTDTQGFYIYRAYRLITWGSWYRMLPRKAITKLSRVRVDIPNSMDAEWTLDIKKSQATPPKIIRDAMKRYVNSLAAPSRRIQQFRGRKTSDDPEARVWDIISEREGTFRYEINERNPYIQEFIHTLSSDQKRNFDNMLQIFAATFPYADIQSRLSLDQRNEEIALSKKSIQGRAKNIWLVCSQVLKMSPQEFVDKYKTQEPFSLFADVETILMEITHE